MPSDRERREHEEEANTTLRRQAQHLVKAKWPTKVKWWMGSVAASIPIIYFLIGGFMWVKTEVAWSADVKQSQNVQFIQNQQGRVDDRMWKVRHDLEKIAEREAMNQVRVTDALDKRTLLNEYTHLIGQKSKWEAAEKEATK